MKYYIVTGSLGYCGTDFTDVIAAVDFDEAQYTADQLWYDEADTMGVVCAWEYDGALERGEITEEELEEIYEGANGGMVCFDGPDYCLEEITTLQQLEDFENTNHSLSPDMARAITLEIKESLKLKE